MYIKKCIKAMYNKKSQEGRKEGMDYAPRNTIVLAANRTDLVE